MSIKNSESLFEVQTEIRVRFSEVDSMGVVWHGNYLKYFEDGVFVGGPQTIFDGKVGIGTSTNLTEKLEVKGNIKACELILEMNGCDFVFEDNYSLMSLDNLKDFIKKYNHLPNIESANEMNKNGVKIAKLNEKLLQKIEELTLYIILLQDRISRLENNQ